MSINQKHFGLSDSLVNAVNEALKGKQHAIDVAEPKGKITGADFKKLRGEGSKPDFLDIDKDGDKKEPMKQAAKQAKEEVEQVDEKAVSQAQQKAAGAALATQRGEYAGGKKGGAVNRMALMKRAELEKIAATKRKGLPMRKEEIEQVDELSKKTLYSYGHKADKQIVRTNVMGVAKRTGGIGMKGGARKLKNRIAGSELAFKKAQKAQEEVEVTEADDAIAKQIAAKKDAMRKQIQQKIAQKQMSVLQQKAQKKMQTIKAGTEKCSCDSTSESKMKCEVHGDDKKLKGGKEAIEIDPPLRETFKAK